MLNNSQTIYPYPRLSSVQGSSVAKHNSLIPVSSSPPIPFPPLPLLSLSSSLRISPSSQSLLLRFRNPSNPLKLSLSASPSNNRLWHPSAEYLAWSTSLPYIKCAFDLPVYRTPPYYRIPIVPGLPKLPYPSRLPYPYRTLDFLEEIKLFRAVPYKDHAVKSPSLSVGELPLISPIAGVTRRRSKKKKSGGSWLWDLGSLKVWESRASCN